MLRSRRLHLVRPLQLLRRLVLAVRSFPSLFRFHLFLRWESFRRSISDRVTFEGEREIEKRSHLQCRTDGIDLANTDCALHLTAHKGVVGFSLAALGLNFLSTITSPFRYIFLLYPRRKQFTESARRSPLLLTPVHLGDFPPSRSPMISPLKRRRESISGSGRICVEDEAAERWVVVI